MKIEHILLTKFKNSLRCWSVEIDRRILEAIGVSSSFWIKRDAKWAPDNSPNLFTYN